MKLRFLFFLFLSVALFTNCDRDLTLSDGMESIEPSQNLTTQNTVDPFNDNLRNQNALHFPGQPREYVATFDMLNNSGVSGEARIKIFGDQISVKISADGAEPNRVHAQHIHGMSDPEMNAVCPDGSADVNGDGIITVGEGVPFYGGIVLSLEDFPTANANGKISYNAKLPYDALLPLSTVENRVIVLHGLTVDGQYIASLPIACGQLVRVK